MQLAEKRRGRSESASKDWKGEWERTRVSLWQLPHSALACTCVGLHTCARGCLGEICPEGKAGPHVESFESA